MTRCESYHPCSGTIYFPTAPFFRHIAHIQFFAYYPKWKKEALYGIQYRTQKQNHRKNSQNEASSVRQKGDSPGSHGFVNRNADLGRAGRSRYRYYLKLQPLQLWSYGRRYPVCSWESSCLSCRWDTGNVRNRVWHQRLVWFYSRRVHSNADGYDREN